jgi:hypothetical protein
MHPNPSGRRRVPQLAPNGPASRRMRNLLGKAFSVSSSTCLSRYQCLYSVIHVQKLAKIVFGRTIAYNLTTNIANLKPALLRPGDFFIANYFHRSLVNPIGTNDTPSTKK